MFLILDVMVLNDIIEQAAGRQSGASDHGGKFKILTFSKSYISLHYLLINLISFSDNPQRHYFTIYFTMILRNIIPTNLFIYHNLYLPRKY